MQPKAEPLEVGIRPISEADREAYTQLLQRLPPEDRRFRFFHAIREYSEAYIEPFVHLDPGTVGLVAEANGEMIGAGHAFSGPDGVFELGVVVDSKWRRHGVAGRLVERLLAALRTRGARALTATSLVENTEFTKMALEHRLELTGTIEAVNQWRLDL